MGKRIIILMITFLIVFVPISNASSIDNVFQQGDNFLNEGKQDGIHLLDGEQISEEIGGVYNILFAVGVALSVLIGAILGIKFMLGSVEEQAKIKEMLIPYVLGCLVIFGAFGIWRMIMLLGGNIFNN